MNVSDSTKIGILSGLISGTTVAALGVIAIRIYFARNTEHTNLTHKLKTNQSSETAGADVRELTSYSDNPGHSGHPGHPGYSGHPGHRDHSGHPGHPDQSSTPVLPQFVKVSDIFGSRGLVESGYPDPPDSSQINEVSDSEKQIVNNYIDSHGNNIHSDSTDSCEDVLTDFIEFEPALDENSSNPQVIEMVAPTSKYLVSHQTSPNSPTSSTSQTSPPISSPKSPSSTFSIWNRIPF